MSAPVEFLAPLTHGAPARLAFIAAACLVASLVQPGQATAGVTSDGRRPTAVESMARVPAGARRPTLRCWQYGRLVYEASDVQLVRDGPAEATAQGSDGAGAAPPGAASNGAASNGVTGAETRLIAGDSRRRVRLLDLNQGLCIID